MSAMNADEARRLREAAGLTRTQVGALIGVSERTIYRYEDGDVKISGPVEIALRQALAKKGRKPAA